jgi:hypothetical protein
VAAVDSRIAIPRADWLLGAAQRYDGWVTYTILDAMADQHIPITAMLDELSLSRMALNDPSNQAMVIARLEQECPDWRVSGALELAFPPTFTPEVPPRE